MRSPQSAAWLSWRTRPLMWLLPVFLLPLWFVGLSGNWHVRVAVGPQWPNRGVILRGSVLRRHIESGEVDNTIRSIDFRAMSQESGSISLNDRHSPENDLRQFRDIQHVLLQFPNLEAIAFHDGQIRSLTRATLGGLRKLRAVSISSPELSEKDLQQLAQLPNLQQLRINCSRSTVDLSHLAQCELLRSIDIESSYTEQNDHSEHLQSTNSIAQLASIPQLRVLCVRGGLILGDSHSIAAALSPEQIDELNAFAAAISPSTNLRRLFLGTGPGPGSLEAVRLLRDHLPKTTVLPASFVGNRVSFLSAMIVPVGFGIALIVLQIVGQLSGPQSMLIPQYRSIHLTSAAVVFAIASLPVVASAWLSDVSFIVIPGLLLAVSAIWLGIFIETWNGGSSALSKSSHRFSSFLSWFRLAGLIVLLIVAVSPFRKHGLTPWLNWFLLGEQPYAALILTVVSIAMLWISVRHLHESHRRRTEAGIPHAVAAQDVIRTAQHAAAKNVSQRRLARQQARWSRRLGACAESLNAGVNGWQRAVVQSRLWLLGAAGHSLGLTLAIFMVVLFAMSFFSGRSPDITVASVDELARHFLGSPMLIFPMQMITIFVGSLLWQRRDLFASELLRPLSRTQWVNFTLNSVWQLTIRCHGVLLLLVLLLRVLAGISIVSTRTIAECITMFAAAALSVGVIVWVVGINRIWIVAAGFIATVIIIAVAGLALSVRYSNAEVRSDMFLDPYLEIAVAVAASVVGLILIASARRYWLTLELAPSAN